MKVRNIWKKQALYGIAFLGMLIAEGCNDEVVTKLESSTIPNNTFTLVPEKLQEVTVKSTNFDDTFIEDVWVLQLQDGKVIQKSGKNLASHKTATTNNNGGYTIAIEDFDAQCDEIYFIANTGKIDLFSSTGEITENDIINKNLTIGDEDDITATNKKIPMVGKWEEGGDIYNITMEQSVAKITFVLTTDLPNGSDGKPQAFAVKSVQIIQVPNQIQYYREAALTSAYNGSTINYKTVYKGDNPETTDIIENPIWSDQQWMPTTTDKACTGVEISKGNNETFTWYLPENYQGQGSAQTQWEKNATNAPNNGTKCTYIEIRGFYKIDGLVNAVTYHVYLGENAINDYNIYRGKHYTVTTTVKGQHRVDTRINSIDPTNYIDYTDNSSPLVVIANGQISGVAADNVDNNDDLGSWSVPTQKQMMLAWIYKGSNEYPQYCWVSETNATGNRGFINMTVGYVDYDNQNSRYDILPIKETGGFKYPYVEYGTNIIVSRDEDGGVKEEYIRLTKIYQGQDFSEQTPTHSERETYNIVAAKFEVAPLPTEGSQRIRRDWKSAVDYCKNLTANGHNDWRMPTQRELMLMFVMNDQLKEPLLEKAETIGSIGDDEEVKQHAFYWSATRDASSLDEENMRWSVCFCKDNDGVNDPTGKTEGYNKAATNYVRCVRDVLDNE